MFNMSQNKFLDDLECEICCHRYDDKSRRPRSLPCGHTFCCLCMAKEINKGKSTCPTCRNPHNAKSVKDLPVNVTVERLIRNLPKTLSVGAKSYDPEDGDEEDDYSEGPCSTHKQNVIYLYCESHSVFVCRECTVLDHPANRCQIISTKDKIEKKKDYDIHQAISTVTAINDTLSVLREYVKEKDHIISDKEHSIQTWKKVIDDAKKSIEYATKSIEDATNTISKEKIASKKARNEISQGSVKKHHVEAAKKILQNAKTKKTIEMRSSHIETVATTAMKWMQDVKSEFDLLLKGTSSSPDNILKGIMDGKVFCAETTVSGIKATAKLTTEDDKLHMYHFKCGSSQDGAITFQYDMVLTHLRQPLSLLFLDLTYKKEYRGRVYIRLQPELHNFIKNIPALFTGEKATSVVGKTFLNSDEYHLALNVNMNVDDISSRHQEGVTVGYGDVVGSCHRNFLMCIYIYIDYEHTHSYESWGAKIGHVVSGLQIARSCGRLGSSEQNYLRISDCGLVLER